MDRRNVVGLALLAGAVMACTGPRGNPRTDRPHVDAFVTGSDHRVEGGFTARSADEGGVWISANGLGGGQEWGVTIRDGTCESPGQVLFIIGPLEHDQLDARLDVELGDLRGKLLVITPLTSDEIVSCGAFGQP